MEQIDLDLLKVYLKKGYAKKITFHKARYLHARNRKIVFGIKKIYLQEDQYIYADILPKKERNIDTSTLY